MKKRINLPIHYKDNEKVKEYFAHHSEINVKDGVFRALYQGEQVEFIHSYNEEKTCCKKINGANGNKLKCESDKKEESSQKQNKNGKKDLSSY